MRMLELQSQDFVCEVCGESAANPRMVGVESDRDITLPIRLCHRCGPIDIDLMQLCRESRSLAPVTNARGRSLQRSAR
jgi:hypothetical protein